MSASSRRAPKAYGVADLTPCVCLVYGLGSAMAQSCRRFARRFHGNIPVKLVAPAWWSQESCYESLVTPCEAENSRFFRSEANPPRCGGVFSQFRSPFLSSDETFSVGSLSLPYAIFLLPCETQRKPLHHGLQATAVGRHVTSLRTLRPFLAPIFRLVLLPCVPAAACILSFFWDLSADPYSSSPAGGTGWVQGRAI